MTVQGGIGKEEGTMKNMLRQAAASLRKKRKMIEITVMVLITVTAFFFYNEYGEKGFRSPADQTAAQEEDVSAAQEADQETDKSDAGDEETGQEKAARIYVEVAGAVKKPGVYEAAPTDRVFQMLEQAGGATSKADLKDINQAQAVYDGEKIYIPEKGESVAQGSTSPGAAVQTGTASASGGSRINLNHATAEELQQIPGIGAVKAQKILEYRQTSGGFRTIEDLMKVSGIGEKTFNKLKTHITV